MASSSSIQSAQAIILCGLCDKENAKWRCVDCDKCICENCKKIHLKVPVMAKHDIVSITTPLQDIQRKIIIDNIPCQDHPNKMTCLFCKTCDTLVCSVCVETKHNNHNFISTEKVVQEKLDQLTLFKTKLAENLKDFGAKEQEIDRVKKKYNDIYNNSIKAIKQKEQELKEAIGKYSSELQEKVEVERSKTEKVMSTLEQQVKKAKKNLEDLKEEITAILNSSQGKKILKVNMKIPDVTFDSLPNELKGFISGIGISNHMKQIEEWFGKLQTVKSFTTDLTCINQVCVVDESLVWITSINDKMIKTMAVKDNTMIPLKEIPAYCGDIAKNSDDDILISTLSGVQLLNKSGEVKNLLTLKDLLPYGIHVTGDDDIIVGVRERGKLYILTDKSQRAIIVFERDGKQKNCYEYDRNGKRLFTLPNRITMNIVNQDILVIDRRSEKTSRVVCVDRKGGLKWTYEGDSLINEDISFSPFGIVTTPEGHIIVSDLNVHAIHVLSMEGNLLACQVLLEIGIRYPVSLDIDSKGQLWVGCEQKNEQSKAKLHMINLLQ